VALPRRVEVLSKAETPNVPAAALFKPAATAADAVQMPPPEFVPEYDELSPKALKSKVTEATPGTLSPEEELSHRTEIVSPIL
jgi:hypothetical protein